MEIYGNFSKNCQNLSFFCEKIIFNKLTPFRYDMAFDQCEGNNGKIYFGFALGVARAGRGKGLGDKLLKASIQEARDQGCSYQYLLASGIYSQKIFSNNGFVILTEKNYEDFKDNNGKILIQHEIHKTNQKLALKL
jgi:GNAT superfamily N-acetyltransferase